MRKLTGYIGALIIVFALAGSILAGYALNVNGSSSVINEYERVTDVSGLYSHTQEPSYIDYNPASNYIGYNIEQSEAFTITNTPSTGANLLYQLYTTPVNGSWQTYVFNTGAYYDENGAVVPFSTPNNQYGYYAYNIMVGNNFRIWRYLPDNTAQPIATDIWINGAMSRYWGTNVLMVFDGQNATINIDNGAGIYTVATNYVIVPKENGNYTPIFNTGVGYYTTGLYSTPGATPIINTVDNWDGKPVFNLYSANIAGSDNWVFVPKTVNYQPIYDIGINYTESNRVNNYLMETTYTGGSVQTVTQKLNLSPSMGLTDKINSSGMVKGDVPRFWRLNSNTYNYNGTSAYIGAPTYTSANAGAYVDNIKSFDLMDILGYYNIPTDKQIIIKPYGTATYQLDNGEIIGDNNFTKLNTSGFYSTPGYLTDKWYCVYTPGTNVYEYYNENGVKVQTSSLCLVTFCGNVPRYGPIVDFAGNILGYYDFGTRTIPYIEITYETETGGTTTYHYADITKGFSIKNDNMVNVIWDNEYNNGNIQILFRADDTNGTYQNNIIVGDNTISINYLDGGYSVTLNNGDPVAVGKWRNIVLNIDLRSGELSVIPVRTFNSYTNVVLDTASIFIGDMVNPTPTNIIEWEPAVNSLMFNVYSTAVFMNTYGVVMINPQLNITEYFTDLNGFYRMRLYNFSVLGSSITVNGTTADVSNNSITIDGQTIQVKDMAITYADGHAYISDSNVNIDMGETTDYNISMSGSWYFETELLKGYTSQKMVYTWDWGDFILNNTQFCIMYMGIALIGLIVARRYCSLSITDYIVLIASFAIALTVQVVA